MALSAKDLSCWKCGAGLVDEPMPLSRLAECRACRAQLHVCRMCLYFDPRLQFGCREDRAEDVTKKDAANFCDWFRPNPAAHEPPDTARADASRAKLDTLFGGSGDSPDGGDPARKALDDLFGPPRK